jgi:hypothetical protein
MGPGTQPPQCGVPCLRSPTTEQHRGLTGRRSLATQQHTPLMGRLSLPSSVSNQLESTAPRHHLGSDGLTLRTPTGLRPRPRLPPRLPTQSGSTAGQHRGRNPAQPYHYPAGAQTRRAYGDQHRFDAGQISAFAPWALAPPPPRPWPWLSAQSGSLRKRHGGLTGLPCPRSPMSIPSESQARRWHTMASNGMTHSS